MQKKIFFGLTLLIILTFTINCTENKKTLNATTSPLLLNPKVVYGEDDRKDPYLIQNTEFVNWARSTVSLMINSTLKENGTHYKIVNESFGKIYGLCKSEPFYNQINPAFCSGSLIGKDLVLTAGHCIKNESDCKDSVFVFDFGYYGSENDNISKVEKSKVFKCAEIVHTQVLANGSDFALIKLDREVTDRSPLPLRTNGTIADNEDLLVIGHPVGLPVKIAGNAKVRSNIEQPYFVANLDTYGGNSGSAVFNPNTGEIEGVLVRGEVDFKYTSKGCKVSNVCDTDGCRGEDVTRISEIIPFLPN